MNLYSFLFTGARKYSGMGIKSNELLGNRLRKAPVLAEVVPRTSYHLQIKSRKTILELRAGASIAIPGLDPVNIFLADTVLHEGEEIIFDGQVETENEIMRS
jgi:hypothetical protein